MGLLNSIFRQNNKQVEYKILDLINDIYPSFTRIAGQNKYSDIEGKILLLSVAINFINKKSGLTSEGKEHLQNDLYFLFFEQIDSTSEIFMRNNGFRSKQQFVIERCKFYNMDFQYYMKGMGKSIPMGICYCLYKDPLGPIEYVMLNDVDYGFIDKYSFTNLPVILKFVDLYLPTHTKFEYKLSKIL